MKKMNLTRRDFVVKTGLSLSGIAVTGAGFNYVNIPREKPGTFNIKQDKGTNGILKKGQVFNESEEYQDAATGRKSRRITGNRKFNRHLSYHIYDCFTPDSKFLLLLSVTDDNSTALLRAELFTGELTVIELFPKGKQVNFTNIPSLGKVAVAENSNIRLIDITTLKEDVVKSNVAGLIFTGGSITGHQAFAKKPGEPIDIEGTVVKPVTHYAVDILSGKVTELYAETRAQCNHVIQNPAYPELILIDRDLPPKFGGGGDNGKTSRVWILNARTGKLTEIRPRDTNRFQIHSNWSFNGEYIYYHGTCATHNYPVSPTGQYIGVADKSGMVIWEGHYPKFFYGHVGSHTKANVIITDALITKDLITALHWQKLNDQGYPMIEILARHDSNWVAGQENHPHPAISPDGKWLVFSRGESHGIENTGNAQGNELVKNIYGETVGTSSRSDVCVVSLA